MKFLFSLFLLSATLMTAGWVYAAPEIIRVAQSDKNTITLTAHQVTSAIDIENAMHTVTAQGTRPGTIILDGRDGPFVYTGDDRSINIFYSNLTFRGINNATILNAGDGFYFDDLLAHQIRIEGLFIVSEGAGVTGVGRHNKVVVRGCAFRAGSTAILIYQGSRWTISENTILAGEISLQVSGGSASKITGNTISATQQGIVLSEEAYANEVVNNSILGVYSSGIALQPGTTGNRVSQNKVLCALGATCQTIEANPDTAAANRISGNQP